MAARPNLRLNFASFSTDVRSRHSTSIERSWEIGLRVGSLTGGILCGGVLCGAVFAGDGRRLTFPRGNELTLYSGPLRFVHDGFVAGGRPVVHRQIAAGIFGRRRIGGSSRNRQFSNRCRATGERQRQQKQRANRYSFAFSTPRHAVAVPARRTHRRLSNHLKWTAQTIVVRNH